MGIRHKETDLYSAIQAAVELAGHPRPLRINSGLAWRRSEKGKLYPVKLAPAGTSDLIGWLRPAGRVLAIECKTPGGRVRPEQVAFLRAVHAAGGVALLADSLDVVTRALGHLARDPGARLDESGFPIIEG